MTHARRASALLAVVISLALAALVPHVPAEATSSPGGMHARTDHTTPISDLADRTERTRHHYGGSAQANWSNPGAGSGSGRLTLAGSSKGGSAPPARGAFVKSLQKQGKTNIKVGKIKGLTKKFRSFTARNARHNLSMKTGYTRVDSDAHHVMPQRNKGWFSERGININHPKHMTWWYRPSHQKYANEYNRKWQRFIDDNPNASKSATLKQARKMRAEYQDKYAPPGPAGCRVHNCRS